MIYMAPMTGRRHGSRRIASLLLVLVGLAPASSADEWIQVVRTGQELPGTGVVIGGIYTSDFGEELRVGTDGRVWMTGLEPDVAVPWFGLTRWSAEEGLAELLPRGLPWEEGGSGLAAANQWLLDTGVDGRLAVAVRSFTGCSDDDPPSAVVVEGLDRIKTPARCDELSALIPPPVVNGGVESMGVTEEGDLAIALRYSGDRHALLAPDGAGGFTIPIRTADPAPGDPLREVAYIDRPFWRAGRLAFMSYLAQDRNAQIPEVGDGDAIYLWDPTAGFSLIARAEDVEPTSAPWSSLSNLQVSNEGYMVWVADSAWDGSDDFEYRTVLFGSDGDGLPEILLAGDEPLPGAPDSKGLAFFPGEMLVMEPDGAAAHVEVYTEGDSYTALAARTPEGGMAMRLRSGQPIPGSGGLVYEQFFPLAASPDGRLVFRTSTSRGSVYALLEPDGRSYLLRQLLPGDEAECAPGDVGTISYLNATSFDPDLRFVAQAVDIEGRCSAIFVTTVPETGASAQGAIVLALLAAVRRAVGWSGSASDQHRSFAG